MEWWALRPIAHEKSTFINIIIKRDNENSSLHKTSAGHYRSED